MTLSNIPQSSSNYNLVVKTLIDTARFFPPHTRFVPCTVAGLTKPPLKEATNWASEPYSADDLIAFPRMQALGLFLGDRYFALDIDSKAGEDALLDFLKSRGFKLPLTLSVWSGKPNRRAYIYLLPDEMIGKMTHKGGSDIELRCGEHYQIVAGRHPETGNYESNGAFSKIGTLPIDFCNALNEWQPPGSSKTKKVNTPKTPSVISSKDDLGVARAALAYLGAEYYDKGAYERRIRVGQALHSVSEDLLPDWVNWCKQAEDRETVDIEEECEYKWNLFDDGRGVTIATLVYFALQEAPEMSSEIREAFSPYLSIGLGLVDAQEIALSYYGNLTKQAWLSLLDHLCDSAKNRSSGFVKNAIVEAVDRDSNFEFYQGYADDLRRSIALKSGSFVLPKFLLDTEFGKTLETYCNLFEIPYDLQLLDLLAFVTTITPKTPNIKLQVTPEVYGIGSLGLMISGATNDGKGLISAPSIKTLNRLDFENSKHFEEVILEEWKAQKETWKSLNQNEKRAVVHHINSEGDYDWYQPQEGEHEPPLMTSIPSEEAPKNRLSRLATEATTEALRDMGANSSTTFLVFISEGIQFLSSRSKYGKGGGSTGDLLELIHLLDGTQVINKRRSFEQKFRYQSSIVLQVQPEPLTKWIEMYAKQSVEAGTNIFGRFIFANTLGRISREPKHQSDEEIQIKNEARKALEDAYYSLFSWRFDMGAIALIEEEEITLQLTPEARYVWVEWAIEKSNLLKESGDQILPAFKVWFEKFITRANVLFSLYLLYSYTQKAFNYAVPVSKDFIEQSLPILDFMIDQAEIFFGSISATEASPAELPEDWQKIAEIAVKRSGKIDLYRLAETRHFRAKGMGSKALRQLLMELEEAKLGSFDPDGKTFNYML